MSNHEFKCRDCGEKYEHEMASDEDVALCKWCKNGETLKLNLWERIVLVVFFPFFLINYLKGV